MIPAMTSAAISEFLRGSPVFAALPPDEIQALEAVALAALAEGGTA